MVDVVKLPPGYSYGYNSSQVFRKEKTDLEYMNEIAIPTKTTLKCTVYITNIIKNHE